MSDQTPKRSLAERLKGALNPAFQHGARGEHVDKRTIISSVFLSMLLGLAYAEMFRPIRDSVRSDGPTLDTMLLGMAFFLVSMRFFIGNQLHLLSPSTLQLEGDIWLFDFMVVTFETTLICFLGGLTTVEVNEEAPIAFQTLLLWLLAVDVVWILSQKGLSLLLPRWRRDFIPWAWAALNAVLLGLVALIPLIVDDPYAIPGLLLLVLINLVGFAVDVFLIDHYDVL